MSSLSIAQLDFDAIKENMKIFLENQEELEGYNFSGSTMNIIMNLLAYVTHYNAVYANMQLNESFLSTAILRSSAVSRAKELGYVPRQYTAAFVEVQISVEMPSGDTRQSFDIPKGTNFIGEKDGKKISFSTTELFTLSEKQGDNFVGTIVLRQGKYVTESFIYDSKVENLRFRISPQKVDTRYTGVEVLPFVGSANREIYTESGSVVELSSDSRVFFWEENLSGDVEVFFGDGVIGKKLDNANEVKVTTFETEGADGNGADSFAIAESVADINKSKITVTSSNYSQSGSDRETINSIKTLAPKLYTVQDRLVTLEDYRAYIKKNVGGIQSLSVWGGDENIPVYYGRNFISIKPTDSDTLSTFEKTKLIDQLKNKIVAGITVEIVDPSLLYVNVQTAVKYDTQKTVFSEGQFKEVVKSSVKNYFEEVLNQFGNDLVYSNLVSVIDESNDAIVGNLTSVSMSKKFIPQSAGTTYLFDYGNATKPLSVMSDEWTDNSDTFYLKETEEGFIDLYRNGVIYKLKVGTIDHSNGLVEFRDFTPSITLNTQIVITVEPAVNNITALRNNILVPDKIDVEASGV